MDQFGAKGTICHLECVLNHGEDMISGINIESKGKIGDLTDEVRDELK